METSILEITGTAVGILYLWLEYRASIYLWIAGIIMPAIYIFVYYNAGLYADFGINIYYLAAAVYGWCFWMWGQRKRKGGPVKTAETSDATNALPIIHTPRKYYLPLLAVFLIAFVGIGKILIEYTDSDVLGGTASPPHSVSSACGCSPANTSSNGWHGYWSTS